MNYFDPRDGSVDAAAYLWWNRRPAVFVFKELDGEYYPWVFRIVQDDEIKGVVRKIAIHTKYIKTKMLPLMKNPVTLGRYAVVKTRQFNQRMRDVEKAESEPDRDAMMIWIAGGAATLIGIACFILPAFLGS